MCGRIILGSFSDRFRIVNGVSVFRACAVDRIRDLQLYCKMGFQVFGSCMCGRQNSIVICNCRIVRSQCKWVARRLQVVLVDELPMEF